MKNQKNTIYHQIINGLISLSNEVYTESKYDDVYNKVKQAYEEYKEIILSNDKNRTNGYGIRYKTIHNDSNSPKNHTIIFSSVELRDSVYEDWVTRRNYWDDLFGCELLYAYPNENAHDFEKIFVSDNIIYTA
jgi:hypothetical protein